MIGVGAWGGGGGVTEQVMFYLLLLWSYHYENMCLMTILPGDDLLLVRTDGLSEMTSCW